MEIVKLSAEARTDCGSRAVRRLRKQGKIPGILYGHQEAAHQVTVDRHDFQEVLAQGSHLLELNIGGTPKPVLIKDVQYDHLGIYPVHADFMRVDLNERVTVSVRLLYRGTPVGLAEGGVFEENMVDIQVETVVSQIPESIRVNTSDLKLGDLLHVRDLVLPEGVQAMSNPDAIVCAVRAKLSEEALEAKPEGEEAQQPEIITARKEEPEGEEKDKK